MRAVRVGKTRVQVARHSKGKVESVKLMQWRSQLSVCCGEGFACVAEAHGNRLAAKMFETRAAMAAPPMKSEHSLMAARPEPAVCALFLAPVWRGRTRRGAANRMAGSLDALKASRLQPRCLQPSIQKSSTFFLVRYFLRISLASFIVSFLRTAKTTRVWAGKAP